MVTQKHLDLTNHLLEAKALSCTLSKGDQISVQSVASFFSLNPSLRSEALRFWKDLGMHQNEVRCL